MRLLELKEKSVLILGFGREGRDTFLFLRRLFPDKLIGAADQNEKTAEIVPASIKNDKKIKWRLGKNYLGSLKDYDVIIKSPGIPAKILPPQKFRRTDRIITSQTAIFFDNCPGTIIGVTGTKGKSTTTALIYNILKAGGFRAHLAGNIGKPVLHLLSSAKEKDVYVYELSSFQLTGLKKSPRIAVFLNIFPEHSDYYKSFNEYVQSKANITRYQMKNDYLIYNSGDKLVSGFAKKSKAKKIPIRGEYYELNKTAARKVGEILKIPKSIIEKSIKNFKPLAHRLELVGNFKGITFYNDALSTIPETAIFAIKNLGRKVQTIFLGGYDRNIDFKKLAETVIKHKNIKTVILFPTTGAKIWTAIKRAAEHNNIKLPKSFSADNMKSAVKFAYENTRKGKICLLSCAATSFSIFKDYRDKGNQFKKFVRLFAKAK